VTRNYLANWIRSHDAHEARVVSLDAAPWGEGGPEMRLPAGVPPDALVIADERDARVRALADVVAHVAREELLPAEWELLQQVIFHELPYADLAEACGAQPGTLRVRAHRALGKLRRAVARRLGDGFTRSVAELLGAA
jgi:DNA-directed RNA polymerase specialized sigma24 family protein